MKTQDYTQNFHSELYDIDSPYSNLRIMLDSFMEVIEDVRGKALLADISEAIESIQFYHLDRLFGEVLRFPRLEEEIYHIWEDEIPSYKNLLVDPSFENGISWIESGTPTRTINHQSEYGQWVYILDDLGDAISQTVDVDKSQVYNISFRARSKGAFVSKGTFGNTTGAEWGEREFELPSILDSTEWVTISGTFQPTDTTGLISIINDEGQFEVDGVQVTESNILYPFTTTSFRGRMLNPEFDEITNDQWNEIMTKDANYRERIKAWMRAIQLGATVEGMKWAYLAATGEECADVLENYRYQDLIVGRTNTNEVLDSSETTITVSDAESLPSVGGAGEAAEAVVKIDNEEIEYTGIVSNDLTGCTRAFNGTTSAAHALGSEVIEADPTKDSRLGLFDPSGSTEFTIVPNNPITPDQEWATYQAVNRLKPANTVCNVDIKGIALTTSVRINSVEASSEHYEVEHKKLARKRTGEYLSSDLEKCDANTTAGPSDMVGANEWNPIRLRRGVHVVRDIDWSPGGKDGIFAGDALYSVKTKYTMCSTMAEYYDPEGGWSN